MKTWLQEHLIIIISLFIASVYAGFVIWFAPDYYFDDFLVFTYVEDFVSRGAFPGPDTPFFLGMRPGFFLLISLLYSLSAEPLLIKIVSSLFYLSFILLAFLTVKKAVVIYHLKLHPAVLVSGLLFLIFHTDTIYPVFWISNANEILMGSFYCGAVFFILLRIEHDKRIYLIPALIFYILSLSAKQTGLQLPLLAGLLLQIFPVKEPYLIKKKESIIYMAAGMLFIAASTLYHLFSRYAGFLDFADAVKKTLAAAGTLLYIAAPSFGIKLYSYFIEHQETARLLFLIVIISVVYLFYKKLLTLRILLSALLIIAVIFYPRIAAPGGDRLNVIQLYWYFMFLVIAASYITRFRHIVSVLLCIGAVSSPFYTFAVADIYKEEHAKIRINSEQLLAVTEYHPENYIIAAAPMTYSYPYIFHYGRHGRFGKSALTLLPAYISPVQREDDFSREHESVYAEKSGDTLRLQFIRNAGVFKFDTRSPDPRIEFLRGEMHPSRRGYSGITLLLRQGFRDKEIVYYTGKDWIRLNL